MQPSVGVCEAVRLLATLRVRSLLSAGESWAPGVQKMLAVHETDGELGVIYLDLFPRSRPIPLQAHSCFCCAAPLSHLWLGDTEVLCDCSV